MPVDAFAFCWAYMGQQYCQYTTAFLRANVLLAVYRHYTLVAQLQLQVCSQPKTYGMYAIQQLRK